MTDQINKEIACFRNDTIGAFVADTKTGISAPLQYLATVLREMPRSLEISR